MNRKPRETRRPKTLPESHEERPTSPERAYEVAYLQSPRKAKSTRWLRSNVTAILGVIFFMIAIWHLLASSK